MTFIHAAVGAISKGPGELAEVVCSATATQWIIVTGGFGAADYIQTVLKMTPSHYPH